MSEINRATAREIAHKHLDSGDPLGWFEDLYLQANGDPSIVPWADLTPNPNLIDWLNQRGETAGRAIKVGSGLGDDAEELTRRGYETTAFDISESAIAWSRRRFPQSSVLYMVGDLFSAPRKWEAGFDLVVESYTLQVLPPTLRAQAVRCIASFVAPGGTLLVIARGREPSEPQGKMPWPLTREEMSLFETQGLREVSFDDYMDIEEPPVRRFRATYQREK
ncbi:MAG: class I SAM-dependent methyltransferase [Desulfobacterales bacterium]|nr:class I SAM-dependent methyltransferase [Desulfobacterales bacterium]